VKIYRCNSPTVKDWEYIETLAYEALSPDAGKRLLERVRKLEAVAEAAKAYVRQPGMSCYVTKKDWEADSDIRGQALMDALDALSEEAGK
jgi:hypothetical protein